MYTSGTQRQRKNNFYHQEFEWGVRSVPLMGFALGECHRKEPFQMWIFDAQSHKTGYVVGGQPMEGCP